MNGRKMRLPYKGSGSIHVNTGRGRRTPNCRAAWESAVPMRHVELIRPLNEP